MPTAGPRFLVRFSHPSAPDRTVGLGFLVAERHILTCAHVVNLALARDRYTQEPPAERDYVLVEFPLADDVICRARVQRWVPPPASGIRGGDVAGLVIVGGNLPAGVVPAQLTSGAPDGRQVEVFGYPGGVGRPDGVWAPGRASGEVGGALLQIDADRDGAWQAQPGFSGAPVIDRASGAVIGMFKAASTSDEYRDSYAIPTSLLCAAWEDVLIILPPNPYKGLAAFSPDDADLFLGRDAEIGLLIDATQRSPLVVVIGPSGVGKSSLVQAGLIPELAASGWTAAVCRPSEHADNPFRALAAALRRAAGTAPDIEKQRAWADEIRTHGLATLATDLRLESGKRTLLVVDQLEELFTLVEDRAVAAQFLERLLELPDKLRGEHPVAVVTTLRADFYHRLLAHPDAAPRLANREVKLSPLGLTALRSVVETPADRRGVSYAPHLADRIVADATTSEGALPLLEFALTELWNHQWRGQLGHEAYGEIGGVVGSLDRHGDHAVRELLDSGIRERDIERTLIALISSSSRENIPATRRTCPADELDAIQRRVAEALTRARLLTATERDQQACYELAHEALIGSWQRLHRTADADGEFLRWRTRLEQWNEKRDGLLPEAWVAEGARWCAERDDIPPRLVDLVRRSQSELQRRVNELRQAHRRAEALRLAAQAQMELIRAVGGTAALALAAESLGLDHTFAGDSAARAALHLAALPISSLAHGDAVNVVVFSPDGAWVATASDDGTARVFDPATGVERTRLAHDGPVWSVVFSPHGAWVATTSTDGMARVFDPATGAERARLAHDDGVNAVVFSPDGAWMATASDNGTVRVFDPATGAEHAHLTHDNWVNAVVFSPDGAWVATASRDGTARVFDPATGAERAHLTHDNWVSAVVFSPDGAWVATASGDGTARVFNLDTGAERARLAHDNAVSAVVFSPDGAWVATASRDGTARVFDPVTGAERARLAHDNAVSAVVFSPDGAWVATASADSAARVFDPVTGAEQARLTHDGWVRAVVFSPDGAWVATASDDGTARVFDPATGVERARLAHDSGVNVVVFSPDGAWVATASDDGTARVLAVGTGELRAAVVAHMPRLLTDAEWQRYGGRPSEL